MIRELIQHIKETVQIKEEDEGENPFKGASQAELEARPGWKSEQERQRQYEEERAESQRRWLEQQQREAEEREAARVARRKFLRTPRGKIARAKELADLAKREAEHEAELNKGDYIEDRLETHTNRKTCPYCQSTIPAGTKFLALDYATRYGSATKAICKRCVKHAARRL